MLTHTYFSSLALISFWFGHLIFFSPSLPKNVKLFQFKLGIIPLVHLSATSTDLVIGSSFPEVQVVHPRDALHTGGQREGGIYMDFVLLDIHV